MGWQRLALAASAHRRASPVKTNPLHFALPALVVLGAVTAIRRTLLLLMTPAAFLSMADAADCRASVRALLVQSSPAVAAVAEARELCTSAGAAGDPVATYHLALLDLGPGGWNPQRAELLIREAAAAGVSEAQYWLAWQLDQGPLLSNHSAEARRWYEAAAARSHRLALLRLAEVYERGELGATPAPARAAALRELAVQCPLETE